MSRLVNAVMMELASASQAFYPLYPLTVPLVMRLTGLAFPMAAVLVSLVCGAVAMLLLHRLVARRHGQVGGNLAVLSVSTFICAPVFQTAYSEGLAFVLVVGLLWTVLRRKYVWSGLLILLLGLTRGVVGAVALALALYVVHLWRARQLTRRDGAWLGVLAAWSLAVGVAWVVAAGVVTGTPNAYRLTQQAWMHTTDILPVLDFVERNSDVPGAGLGSAMLAVAWTVLLIWLVTWKQHEPLLKAWSAAYVLYLLALLDWAWSNVRYFILTPPVLWPLVGPLSQAPDDRHQRIAVVAVLALMGGASMVAHPLLRGSVTTAGSSALTDWSYSGIAKGPRLSQGAWSSWSVYTTTTWPAYQN